MMTTPGSDISKLLEMDKKSLIEAALNTGNFKSFSQAFTQNTQASGKTVYSEFEALLNNAEIDDSDEIFNNALKKVEEKLKLEEDFKKKNPGWKHFDFLFKEPKKPAKPRKRTSKVLEDNMNVMNRFKRQLAETQNIQNGNTMSTIDTRKNGLSTVNTTANLEQYSGYFTTNMQTTSTSTWNTKVVDSADKKENYVVNTKVNGRSTINLKRANTDFPLSGKQVASNEIGKRKRIDILSLRQLAQSSIDNTTNICYNENIQDSIKVYPKWKHTATHTPIFNCPVNPEWKTHKNKMFVEPPKPVSETNLKPLDHLYTPSHIKRWMEGVDDNNLATFSSCKSIKSNVAVFSGSVRDENEVQSLLESPEKIATETTKRSTVVRFKTSSPELIPCSYDSDRSSIQSDSLVQEAIRNNEEIYKYHGLCPENYDSIHDDYSEPDGYYPQVDQDFSPVQDHVEKYESCYRSVFDGDYKGFEEHHFSSTKSSTCNKNIKDVSGDLMRSPFFEENFIKLLNHSISNDCNMELKYSVNLKYSS